MKFYSLPLAEVHRPLYDVVELIFDLPEEYEEDFAYNPGQHIIIRHRSEGQEFRRPYALTSSPFAGERPAIAVKRINNGVVSEYLYQHALEGMILEVGRPQGFYFADVNASDLSTYFLFAQDMGMAPQYSIIKSILKAENTSRVFLYYENSQGDQILFRNEIEKLRKEFPNRFGYMIAGAAGPLAKLLSTHEKLSRSLSEKISSFLETKDPRKGKAGYFICGDTHFVKTIRDQLRESGRQSESIYHEIFYQKDQPVTSTRKSNSCTIEIDGELQPIPGRSDQTILQSLIDASQKPDYACRQGLCSTCAIKLLEGEVTMARDTALQPHDGSDGWILACTAYPDSEVIRIST